MSCLPRKSVCQHQNARLDYEADWAGECAYYWEAGKGYALNEVMRPSDPTGFEGKATAAGQSGADEPKWRGKGLGDTVADGSLTWTLQKMSGSSLRKTIASQVWTAPAGFTVDGPTVVTDNGNQKTRAFFSCPTVGVYEVVNRVTFNDGSIGVAIFDVEIEA